MIGGEEAAGTCLVIGKSGTLYMWYIQISLFVLPSDIIVQASATNRKSYEPSAYRDIWARVTFFKFSKLHEPLCLVAVAS